MLNTNKTTMFTITREELFKKIGTPLQAKAVCLHCVWIEHEYGFSLWDYGTLIAVSEYQDEGTQWYYTIYHDYSKTTMKWLKNFDKKNPAIRKRGLNNGTYIKIVD